ncbi:lysoplasmalogenase [Pukyongiella litopenaei]|uniref:Lysoplasmalogenase n=1 Tax=Pukyongiella litopenaei TaxID=2605946 RepID=A0A2S0MM98_9RHOB|nr:lysoplasmalogenase [Pukyongiella litopenaei]AVO36947.1 lysoplasmalogenase [Pukyongiella litopenaei]
MTEFLAPAAGIAMPLAVTCALIYLPLASRPPSTGRTVAKTGAVGLLALAAWAAQGPALLVLALLLCSLGDACLSRSGDRAFITGAGAFALGHLVLIALFLGDPAADPARILAPPRIWIALGLGVLVLAVLRWIGPRAGAMRGVVSAYIPVILAMGLAALCLPGDGRLALVVPAALAFMLSDTVLAIEKFALPPDHPALRWTPGIIWPFYWGAMFGIWYAFI